MDFELRFTDREITPWGGLGLMERMLGHIGFREALAVSGLPQPGSNRGYAPVQLVLQFILSIWCGGNRFEHAEVVRHDHVLRRMFGFARMANFKAIIRFFGKFNQARNDSVFTSLYQWLFGLIGIRVVTLDLDSTVITRFGLQQGVARGYNPHKRGRASHHPLMAFVSDIRLIANCWLRPGNTSSANNVIAFLEATLRNLGQKTVGLLRADSGFSDSTFLNKVEALGIHYVIALKLFPPLQRALVGATNWWQLDTGIQLTEFEHHSEVWGKTRRVIAIRQHIARKADAKGKQLSLFADSEDINQYRYAVLVTDLKLAPAEIWRLYRGRADCENRIKELKYDFGVDSFCLRDFWATEASLNMAMIAYNLMSLFRQAAMRATVKRKGVEAELHQTLRTLRYQVFAKPAYTGKEGRLPVLKFAIPNQHREWFEGLWNRSKTFDLPVTFSPSFTP